MGRRVYLLNLSRFNLPPPRDVVPTARVLMHPVTVVEEEEPIAGCTANNREDHKRDDEKPDALLFLNLGFCEVRIVDGGFSLHINAVILDFLSSGVLGGADRHRREIRCLVVKGPAGSLDL
jgi:hypothetical protein